MSGIAAKLRLAGALVGVALLLMPSAGSAQNAAKTLRFIPQADLRSIDPIWTTAYVTRNFGYLVFDTLFALDKDFKPQPQMVDSWTVSDDKLTYKFALRDGLKWHDGQPVRAADCTASIERWAKRDQFGQKMIEAVASMTANDDKSFTIALKAPFPLLLNALGKLSSNVPFMMPERLAKTDAFQQIPEAIGSGPFKFVKEEWVPGSKAVFVKNADYVPRKEPPSLAAGGKVAKVDRVEIVEMPDVQQQVNALIAGEIDLVEQPPHDLLPVLKADKNVVLEDWNPLGHVFVIRFNHVVKPFDNPKIRLAALYSMRQEDYLKATIGDPAYYKVCPAAFICGTPNASDKTNGLLIKPDFEKSKALLKEAGYDGTPIVLMQSTTLPVLTNMAPVTKSLLEQGGFKVDMQSMDWQTLVTRRTKKDPADKGGWNAFHTFSVSADALNPISNSYFAANGDKAWFGWPVDPEMEKLRDAYARETDPAKAKALAETIQLRAVETAQFGWLGQWYGPGARRANVTGWLKAPVPVMWNIEKK